MRLSASCCLLLAVFVLGGPVVHVEGAENPSYTAYALGKYMTARKPGAVSYTHLRAHET